MSCELIGVHVKDSQLERVADSGFARGVSLESGRRFWLNGGSIEQQVQAQVVRIRRDFSSQADRAGISWSFAVGRGRIGASLLSSASQVDLVAVGKAGRSVVSGTGLGSVAREVLSRAPGVALVVAHGTALQEPVVVVYEPSAQAERALLVAAGLTGQESSHLEVILLAEEPEQVAPVKAQAMTMMAGRGLLARCHNLIEPNVQGLARVIEAMGRNTVVLPAGGGVLDLETVLAVIERIQNAVFVVH
jgi:nucleotide-binding universal stress UspA family protein